MLALQNQNILVLGLGASGMAMLRWCVKQGAQVLVSDTRDQPPQLQALREELPGVRFVPASAVASQGIAFDRILRSPGIAPVELEVLLRGLALRSSHTRVKSDRPGQKLKILLVESVAGQTANQHDSPAAFDVVEGTRDYGPR